LQSFVHEKAKQKGLELLLNVGVEKFNDKGETIEVLNDGTSVETDAVILAIGVKPETKLA
jgi:NADPH-dependent 2,4-dienoyl-CoA reductase/sulfur reductase-like enzyme